MDEIEIIKIVIFSSTSLAWFVVMLVVIKVKNARIKKLEELLALKQEYEDYNEDDFGVAVSGPSLPPPIPHIPPPTEWYWDDIHEDVWVDSKLSIKYVNANGEYSERNIDIKNYDGSCYLRGYCYLRNERRTFRIDRVQECVDIKTGYLVEDIPKFLRSQYESTPEYLFDRIMEKHGDIIKALIYVGKADGQLRKTEREVIISVCKAALRGKDVPDEDLSKLLNKVPTPSPQAFKLAIDRISKSSIQNLKVVQKKAEQIVATQKTVHPSEKEALEFIDKKLKQRNRLCESQS